MDLNHIGTKNIEINRLLLRKFKKDDAKEIFETWLSDADVAKYMVWNPHNRLEETNKWLEKCILFRNIVKREVFMKFILITGPQAVGKMTVGQELVKLTNLKLLHNHMTIELLTKIFNYSRDSFRRLNEEFRVQIFEEFAKSDQEGLIFTTTWDFDSKEDWKMMYRFIDIFKKYNSDIYIIELESTLDERLKRNKTENRLANKASKRDLEWSEKDLLKSIEKYRFNSKPNEIEEENYLRINNTDLSAEAVALIIKEKFKL